MGIQGWVVPVTRALVALRMQELVDPRMQELVVHAMRG